MSAKNFHFTCGADFCLGTFLSEKSHFKKVFMNELLAVSEDETGYPEIKTQSATILLPPSDDSGTLSDVFSKPLFIAKKENKINFAKLLNIKYFLIMMDDDSILISKSLNNEINWEDDIDKKNITIH